MDIYSKFDLHIHSSASAITKTGDKAIVADSTADNLPVLIDKLKENEVNIVSITDHNIFDRGLYLELKKQENENNTIFKVLPGVEIDLNIENKIVHVVCVFDDTSFDYLDKIVNGFERKNSYTVDELGAMLRKIELGTILIAHQKCDYTTERQQKTSLSYSGKEHFYKFIGCEFFDALEIQNTKVEGILKSRFSADNISNVNLVVGSDCHQWEAYPAHDLRRDPVKLMYMKALPTFQGLVMAITDNSRLYQYSESSKENTLKELIMDINGKQQTISLSDRINVIIGDNSVGKSTLVKYLSGLAEKGAVDFLKSHKVHILSEKLEREYFAFSGQGKIREMFESNQEKLPIKEKFKEFFKPIDKKKYEAIIFKILSYYKKVWDRNDQINNNIQILKRNLYIPTFTEMDKYYMSVESNISKQANAYKGLVNVFEELHLKFKDFNDYNGIMKCNDIKELLEIRKNIINLGRKYYNISEKKEFDLEIKAVFEFVAEKYTESISKQSCSDEIRLNSYRIEYQRAIESICLDLEYRFSTIEDGWNGFKNFKIMESINQMGRYSFVNKVIKDTIITKELIRDYISDFLDTETPLEKLTSSEVLSSIKTKKVTTLTAENINQLLTIIYKKFLEEYMTTTVEIKQGNDMLNESNSAGINALYYIDILSETYSKPIFIIDQPEDDVSQSRIATNLIPSLKKLSNKTQVIIVTHNPQLVVNLDADNVIVIKKDNKDINFYSGPLEFRNTEYAILDLVANTLDGGAAVIRKRWKRYDKTGL